MIGERPSQWAAGANCAPGKRRSLAERQQVHAYSPQSDDKSAWHQFGASERLRRAQGGERQEVEVEVEVEEEQENLNDDDDQQQQQQRQASLPNRLRNLVGALLARKKGECRSVAAIIYSPSRWQPPLASQGAQNTIGL